MISSQTVQAFFGDLIAKCKDQRILLDFISELMVEEPHFAAAVTLILSNVNFTQQITGQIFAVAIYKQLAQWQQESDDLKDKMSGQTQ